MEEENLQFAVVFSLQLYCRIDNISPPVTSLCFEAAFISIDTNQAQPVKNKRLSYERFLEGSNIIQLQCNAKVVVR